MGNTAKWITALAVVAFGALPLHAAQNGRTKLISFDAPGADLTAGSFNGTIATGVNNFGSITGYYLDANEVSHGFLRSPGGTFAVVDVPGAEATQAQAINDRGEITGVYFDSAGLSHGFLRNAAGKFTSFDVAGSIYLLPIALNVEGTIVGYSLDAADLFHGFVRNPDGVITTFVGPDSCTGGTGVGCYGTEDSVINAFGFSVGNYADPNLASHSVLRTPQGKLLRFDAPESGTGPGQGTGCPGCFAGLNLSGAISGIYTDASTVYHAYIRTPEGRFITIDAPGAGTSPGQGTGCPSDCFVGLNDWGAVTGAYIDAGNVLHGFLRDPWGRITTLDPPGTLATEPQGINDSGMVMGYYIDGNLVYHGFLLGP